MHVQGGFLVSIAREAAYQADLHAGDVIHFATDMGWIMGPWTLVGAGRSARRSSSPRVLPTGRLRPPVADGRERAGDVARALADAGPGACAARRAEPDRSSLRTFVTTGEPWNPEPYRWLFEEVGGARVPVINCSGGTEVGACFLSPTVTAPIKACSVGGPALGMAMDIVDERGARSSAPARSASSSAGSRSRG